VLNFLSWREQTHTFEGLAAVGFNAVTRDFAKHFSRSPEQPGPAETCTYQASTRATEAEGAHRGFELTETSRHGALIASLMPQGAGWI
jgi:hypothetical protein